MPKVQAVPDRKKVFIDLANYEVTGLPEDKRIKVLRPKESSDLRSVKGYILSRITVIIDLSAYTGDWTVATNIIRDSVSDCGGSMTRVNSEVIIAAPFDVAIDGGQA